ncbi:MAG: FUSC family protein [Actinomycetota bacterium]|nr:FUSC family protein [Actinomycetota bacterium]
MPPSPATQRRRELLRRGRNRVDIEQRDLRDRLIASDPGLSQLRLGIRVLVGIGSTLGVEWLLATALNTPVVLPMLLGAIIAMVLSSGIRENTRHATLRAAAPALPAAAIGASLSVVTAPVHVLSLAVFVVISFLAVWVRKFGGAWVTYGLLCWQAYFFALFLHPPVSQLLVILAAVAISAIWVTLLMCTVLYEDPAARLRRTVTALRARARAGISVALELLDDPDDEGAAKRLRSHLVQISEVALLFDGQLSEARALPPGVRPSTLRRWVVEVEIGMDELVGAVLGFADLADGLPGHTVAEVRATLQALGWGDTAVAVRAAQQLASEENTAPVGRRVGTAAEYLVTTIDEWTSGELLQRNASAGDSPGSEQRGADDDPDDDPHDDPDDDDDFEQVVTLRAGRLPGSAPLAEQAVTSDDAPWWSPAHLALTTRQAIQASIAATLAIWVGQLISPQRYYWAVIAAFIAFTGTATASETVRRSVGRVVGTALGLVAAVFLANVTAGHTVAGFAVLLIALALAWYLFSISYGGMIFGITIALGQLYSLLHTFSDQVLELRLAETIAGAVIGAVVGALVLPAGAMRTLRVARRQLLDGLAELLDDCAATVTGAAPPPDVLAGVVTLDAHARQVVKSTQSLIRGRFFGSDRAGLRRRVAVLGVAASTGRVIASLVSPPQAGGAPTAPTTGTAASPDAGRYGTALGELAAESRRLGAMVRLEEQPVTEGDSIAERVAAQLESAPNTPLRHQARKLADTLALLTPRGR